MQTARERANQLFSHYMEVLGNAAGVKWNGDNYTEWEILIDSIIEAAKEEATGA